MQPQHQIACLAAAAATAGHHLHEQSAAAAAALHAVPAAPGQSSMRVRLSVHSTAAKQLRNPESVV